MCGISGIISLNNDRINCDALVRMTAAMENRGPDAFGYLTTNYPELESQFKGNGEAMAFVNLQHLQQIGLGHRRLSITDLSEEAIQPMCDSTKRYWIVFNGQIYNHAEIKKELRSAGYRFKTDHSDTEVILNAYSYWGIECLAKFNGTWAFCLWDSVTNTIFIARDRVGVRPLYYTVHNKQFYFASELNALLTNKSLSRNLDEAAIYDYLTYTNVPAPNTIINEINKLPAAHYLFFKPGEAIVAKRYWNPERIKTINEWPEDQIIDKIRETLHKAVQIRMEADVDVGMLLSGGLDSSINLACMSKYSKTPVSTYTVGFENTGKYKNEFEQARTVASLFNANHHELIVTEDDFFNFLPQLGYLQDEPIADPAVTPLHFISRLASKDGIKVMLGGEGSDELFIGYEHWRLIYEFEKVFLTRPRLAGMIAYAHKNSIFKEKRPHYQTWAYKLKNNWPTFWSGTELRTEDEKHRILNPDFLNKIGVYNSFTPLREHYDHLTSAKTYETFGWMTINDLQHRLPDQLLARLDRMMMTSAIEGRHPFLDVNMINLALSIPPHLKVRQKTEKYLLKKAFETILPNEIIYRPKDSFSVPIDELFKNPKRKKEYLDLIAAFNKDTGIFRNDYIQQLGLPARSKEFWNVLNLALWHQSHK